MLKTIAASEKTQEMTNNTMDLTAQKLSKGYDHVYESSCTAKEAFREKINETGISDRANHAFESVKYAGSAAFATGVVNATMISSKIEEHENLTEARHKAAETA